MAFPPFLWGAATSAHQVEGNTINNDWWAWEKKTPGITRSGQACDHFERFADDFALARSLGHNAHRLSLEWSRIEFARGQFSDKALAHYREVLQELRRQDLVSFVTLHHFTNPLWFAQAGGWERPDAALLFSQYVEVVVTALGDLVDFWVTINEPNVYVSMSYWNRRWPPQVHSLRRLLRVTRHLAAAHTQAYQIIHRRLPSAKVGLAQSVVAYEPARTFAWTDRTYATLANWWSKHRWYQQTHGTHDFLGLNYYFSSAKKAEFFPPKLTDVPWTGPVSDLNWPINPAGLTHILVSMKRYGLPIYITENGLADADDSRRAAYVRDHIRAIEAAQAQGVDVRGYLHWSLLDNFEWDLGFTPRFGLVHVDYATQQRTPRPSAYVYKAIIELARK